MRNSTASTIWGRRLATAAIITLGAMLPATLHAAETGTPGQNEVPWRISTGARGIAEPGGVEPQVQKTLYGWEIIDWKTADINHEGEAVFTVTPETPLQNATVLSYIDDKLTLEPLDPGETRTSLVFRLPLRLKRAQGRAKVPGVGGSQWGGFGSGNADYGAELPFVSTLPLRVVNVAEDAIVTVTSADKLSKGFRPLGWLNRPETLTDGFIDRDRNFFSAPRDQDITADAPESVLLSWDDEQSLRLLGIMRGRGEGGLGDVRVEIYTGSGDPRFARDGWELCSGSWMKAGVFRAFSLFDFGRDVKTRAVRLVCTGGVKQIGLGEVLALQALGDAPVPVARKTKGRVPVQFTIPDSGKVTVQIRNAKGDVVANPVAGVEFREGTHTVYWDLTDIAGNPVTEPGAYSWKGLYVPGLKVAYQYSYYPTPLNNVPWQTPDRSGGWLADHEPPRTICRVGDTMWLGAFAEAGDSIIEVDNAANKLWGIDRIWVAIPSEICGDGDYYYGFCEGGWIGDNQAIIQIDTKTKASRKVFQREFKGLKENKSGVSGFQVVGERAFAAFASTNAIMVFDISAGIRATPRGFSWDSAYKQFDELKPVLIQEISLPAPGRIRQYGPDCLVAVSGRDIVTIDLKTYEVKTLIKDQLVNPLGLGTDAKGNLYIGEGAPLHQVFGYTPEGRKFLTLGKPGRREPGAFDNDNLEEPFGVEVASDGRVWVMEHTDWTRRVSIWDPQTARCVKAVYGPTQYGGDGCLDPADETRVFYKGMEFRRDPVTGTVTPLNMTYRADNTTIASFDAKGAGNYPSYAFRAKTRKGLFTKDDLWFTSYMPPHEHPVLVLWLYKKGIVKPVAAMGSAFSLRTTFGEPPPDKPDRDARTNTDFLMKHIPGYTTDQKFFTWTDLNDDGKVGVDELKFGKLEYEGKLLNSANAGWNWRMNGNFVAAANAGENRAVFFTPSGFTQHGYPLYAVPTNTVPGNGQALITDSQNNAIILGGPITCVTPEGKVKWSYRNQWPGLHAGHTTTARGDEPGVLIAPTRAWGVVPVNQELGEVVAFNSNLGCTYLMTAEDGLYIDRIFRDQRVGLLWNSPEPPTPEVLAETSLYDEHFGGLLQKTIGPDGREKFVYVVGKNHCSVVELTGLDQIQRLTGSAFTVTSETVLEAHQRRQDETLRTAQPKSYTVRQVLDGSIIIDAHDREWGNPERIEGFALAYDSQNLYIHFRGQDDKAVFQNKGVNPIELFKTGDVLDVMLQTKKGLKPRTDAGEGDIRLSFAMFEGKPVCVLYDFKIAGHQGERVPFSSPTRTIWFDRVSILPEARIAVARQNSTVLLEAAVPLKSIHLAPADLKETLGDVGRVLSDQTGTRASNRVYWSNKNTNIMSDLPSEAMLQPRLWGLFRFE